MRRKTITAAFLAIILSLCMCCSVFAAEPDSAGNLFEAGETISFSDIPFFGGMAFGKQINVDHAQAKGSVMAAGETVSLEGSSIEESLYAGGETVTIKDTTIKGNLFVAGKNVQVSGLSTCNGIYMAGEEVVFEGTASGFLAGGTQVVLGGTINGDAEIHAEKVEISPNLIVTGKLKVLCTEEPAMPEGAQVGDYSYEKITQTEEKAVTVSKGALVRKKVTKGLYWVAAMVAFGLILCWLFNDHLDRAGQYLTDRRGAMIGSGIGGWIGIPIAAILLCCTAILAPMGGMLLLAYVLFLCAGVAFAGASLSRLVFPGMNVFLAAAIGIAVLEILKLIPVLGVIIAIVADMYLLAYAIQYVWCNRLRRNR